MNHPFTALAGEYARLLDAVHVTAALTARKAAARLLDPASRAQFAAVSQVTGVPVVWLAATLEREASGRLTSYLGNGQSLHRRTTIVPKGRGPFATWSAGAIDALKLLHLDQVAGREGWTLESACYHWEAWNGFGPRARGIHTGYLWAGTDHYARGKYVSDGRWDPHFADPQLGCVPLYLAMVAMDASLALPRMGAHEVVPTSAAAPPAAPAEPVHDTAWLQASLNKALTLDHPLTVDGNFGRLTRAAVMEFQKAHGLSVDGVAGPRTIAALAAA
jgi:lysozyme family protein